MGDRKPSILDSFGPKPRIQLQIAKDLLRKVLNAQRTRETSTLCDEVYVQLVKQTTNNPHEERTVREWELMIYCLATFPPTKASYNYRKFLREYFTKSKDESRNEEIRRHARFCLEKLDTAMVMSSRQHVPSILELTCIKERKTVRVTVYFIDGVSKSFSVDSYTLVLDVEELLVQQIGLTVSSPFSLYEADEATNGESSFPFS